MADIGVLRTPKTLRDKVKWHNSPEPLEAWQ